MQQLFPGVYSLEGEIGGRPLQGFEALMCCRYDVYREDHGIFYDGDALAWLREEGDDPPQEICTAAGPVLGDWPRETDIELVFAAARVHRSAVHGRVPSA